MKTGKYIVAMVVVWSLVSFIRGGGPGIGSEPGLYSGFESLEVWDISPERGFDLALSTEHVTQGTHSLKVVFPQEDWPSINTKKLKQPMRDFEAMTFDVFNPHTQSIHFVVRVDDRSGKKVNVEYKLKPGENHVRVGKSKLSRRINTEKMHFVVLFLKRPQERYTLYFDNLRLEEKPAAEADRAKTGGRTQQVKQDVSAPSPWITASLPQPAVEVPAPKAGALELEVLKFSQEAKPTYLVSNGIPFAPGQLVSERDVAFFHQGQELALATRVLARWPQDQSIRSLLVQFQLPMAGRSESATLRWGTPRTTTDVPITEVVWAEPDGFVKLPALWLCDSQVIGEQVPMGGHPFGRYDKNIRTYYPKRRDDRLKGDIRADGYYSTPHVFYQLYVRSADPEQFLSARKELLHYREKEIRLEGSKRGAHVKYSEPRYCYVEALADDYLFTGDERSKEVAGFMAEYLSRKVRPEKAMYPKGAKHFWTERYYAAGFLGVLSYYEISGDSAYLTLAEQYMDNLYKTQLAWPERGGFIHNLYAHDPEEGARIDEYGGSPFMTGLLLEAIVKHHRLTGSEQAARSIFLALDWLMNEALAPDGKTFVYLTADAHQEQSGPPDLNLLIVHALGYGYKLSGYTRTDYLEVGIEAFKRGIQSAYLKKRKHFNQNYRSSGHFPAYIAQPRQPAHNPDAQEVLYAANFDYTLGRWAGLQGTRLGRDSSSAYGGHSSLRVEGKSPTSPVRLSKRFTSWSIRAYPTLRFAYRVPAGVSVNLRVRTPFGDWIRLMPQTLVNDDQWHETTIDVAQVIGAELPGIRMLTELQYFADGSGEPNNFWVDEIRISE